MGEIEIIIRLLIATFLGGLVGFEREIHGCAAGLRTHILVSIGSAVFMLTSLIMSYSYGHIGNVDPSRIAAGVVTGIGFLGAGAIIRYGYSIRGLTTAASIWAVSAIGLSAGAGMYLVSGTTTAVVVGILFLHNLEEHMEIKSKSKKLLVKLDNEKKIEDEHIMKVIRTYGGKVERVKGEQEEGGLVRIFSVYVSRHCRKDVVADILLIEGVLAVKWV